jgi:hypothetical protein
MSDPLAQAPFTMDLVGCARCRGEGHPRIVFMPLEFPIEIPDSIRVFTHWAPCPANGEPILFTTVETPEKGDD